MFSSDVCKGILVIKEMPENLDLKCYSLQLYINFLKACICIWKNK